MAILTVGHTGLHRLAHSTTLEYRVADQDTTVLGFQRKRRVSLTK